MATTPPEQPAGSRPPMGMPNLPAGARLPIPGNAEFAFFVAIEIFLAILLFDDAWNVNDWAKWSAILGGAYLISRGIAKASRVLEQ
ncbi:MAG TPA: hypothetical protein VHQ98_04180 [Gaiellaceae bacterium]|jgi:hypothetical protein|nr:hypothetical protein [Gaiellaceae bacterium]